MKVMKKLFKKLRSYNDIKFLAGRVSVYYCIFGVCWIALSDNLTAMLIKNSSALTIVHVTKGWIYVIITSILLYNLIGRNISKNIILTKQLKDSYEELAIAEEELRAQLNELKVTKDMLRLSDERYELALESSDGCVWELDIETKNFYASNGWKQIMQIEVPQKIDVDKFTQDYVYEEDKEKFGAWYKKMLMDKGSSFDFQFRINAEGGSYIWLFSKGKVIRNQKGQISKIIGILVDVSEKKQIEEKINFCTQHDRLTNLYNREFFIEKLKLEMQESENNNELIGIIFIDIDDFKNINEVFGHDFGDRVLVLFSKTLSSIIESKGFLCRMGGDEFLVAVTNQNAAETINVLSERILQNFNKPLRIEEKQIDLAVSIGTAVYPTDGTNAAAIIKNADIAMHEAKKTGKSKVCTYNDNLMEMLVRKTNIISGLVNAIIMNSFELYYQPKIDCKANKLCGFEALLRWNSPEYGRVSPAEFIPIAEESGLIIKIGNWVIEKVCKQIKEWSQMGYEFSTVSINVSAAQFLQHDFVSNVSQLIHSSGVKPEKIEIEITETTIMTNISENIEKLRQLKNMGLKVSMDDFGTGYSSLNYLRKIPVDIIKIDKSFIDNIYANFEDSEITKLIINVAHQLKYHVVAEGVETLEQLDLLKAMHCDIIQGYYFSKPLPPEEAEVFMTSAIPKGDVNNIQCS